MKKFIGAIQYYLILIFITSVTARLIGLSNDKIGQSDYLITRYVIGSGGVMGAKSQNYIHHGTAGQTIVGGAQGANNILGSGFWIQSSVPTEVSPSETQDLPTTFTLYQNHPNPFNPETIIEYDLPSTCLVAMEIFNSVGQRIRLINPQDQGPGHKTVVWDGRDDQGQTMGSAVYFYRITAFSLESQEDNHHIQFQQTKKMSLLK